MASISIRESQPTSMSLTASQAAALQAAGQRLASNAQWWGGDDVPPQRTVIRCEPIYDGRWEVTVVDAVGLIAVGTDLQIRVVPKIPSAHLLYLFAASGRFPRLDQESGLVGRSESLWELV